MFSSLNSENELLGGNRADVGVTSGSLSQHQVEASLWPLFAAHGIVPSAQRPLVPDKPPVNFNAEMFHHRGLVALEGVKCELIRTEPLDAAPAGTDELWVDPTANGFIRRHVYYAGKNPFIRLDTKPQLKAEAHIPKEWTCTWYEGARAKVIHRLEVDQFVGNLSVTDEDFQIALKPGMKVEERNIPTAGSGLNPAHPKIKKYTVTRSGETDFQETHQRRLDGTDVEPEGRPRWIWCVAGVVAVGAGVVIYLRWKRVRGGK